MKRSILLFLVLMPLALGFAYAVMGFFLPEVFWSTAASLAFLLFWGLLGFLAPYLEKPPVRAAFFCNLPALTAFLLLLYQEIFSNGSWPDTLGLALRLFFLPVLSITFAFEGSVLFRQGDGMGAAYVASFVLMTAVSLCGCLLSAALHRMRRRR